MIVLIGSIWYGFNRRFGFGSLFLYHKYCKKLVEHDFLIKIKNSYLIDFSEVDVTANTTITDMCVTSLSIV